MGRVLDRRERTFDKSEGPARQVYPTPLAQARRGTEPKTPRAVGSSNYFDDDATRCVQCGQAIENRNARTTCPLCGSDNFEGKVEY